MSSINSSMQEVSAGIESNKKMQFPEIIDGKISTEEFLQAACDVIETVRMYYL